MGRVKDQVPTNRGGGKIAGSVYWVGVSNLMRNKKGEDRWRAPPEIKGEK